MKTVTISMKLLDEEIASLENFIKRAEGIKVMQNQRLY